MTLVVEDGTGLATANSLCLVATVDTFWADRNPSAAWVTETTPNKEAALIRASDYIRNQVRYRWSGAKKSATQRMPWPRIGAAERDGQAVAEGLVPWQVAEAAAYLANTALGVELQPDLPHGGQVKLESLTGALSVTYADKARVDTAIQFVDGVLAPLLRRPGMDPYVPVQYEPDIPSGFRDDEFTSPPSDTTTS